MSKEKSNNEEKKKENEREKERESEREHWIITIKGTNSIFFHPLTSYPFEFKFTMNKNRLFF